MPLLLLGRPFLALLLIGGVGVQQIPLVAAQESCMICQDGSSVATPEKRVNTLEASGPGQWITQTCAEMELEAANNPEHWCSYYHYYGNLCGCTLCQDGSLAPNPDHVVLTQFGKTCREYEAEAQYVLF